MTGFQFSISCCRFPILLLSALLGLTACGGGGGGEGTPLTGPAEVSGTLAYVETQCRGTGEGFFEHQSLRIRQGEGEPVTVFETPEVSKPGVGYLCAATVGGHFGDGSVAREAFQQVTVSPNGASVAFEVSDVFVIDETKNALQLTNFGRVDTGAGSVDVDRDHVYFEASADPLRENSSFNCQIFSIDRLGGDLRQITNFSVTDHSNEGCY